MNNHLEFEMRIHDLFKFSDGRTVFVGTVTSPTNFIQACKCQLIVNSTVQEMIQIEGEMIPDRPHPEGYRSLSTREPVQLDRETVISTECLLKYSCP
jgi:hypothetical protein